MTEPPRIIVYPPSATLGQTNAVQQVRLRLGERVEWLWHHSHRGSFVTGYNIIRPDQSASRAAGTVKASQATHYISGTEKSALQAESMTVTKQSAP